MSADTRAASALYAVGALQIPSLTRAPGDVTEAADACVAFVVAALRAEVRPARAAGLVMEAAVTPAPISMTPAASTAESVRIPIAIRSIT
jgi:hypothetical protein